MIQQVFARRKAYFLACYRGANFDERPIRTADIGNGLITLRDDFVTTAFCDCTKFYELVLARLFVSRDTSIDCDFLHFCHLQKLGSVRWKVSGVDWNARLIPIKSDMNTMQITVLF